MIYFEGRKNKFTLRSSRALVYLGEILRSASRNPVSVHKFERLCS